MGWALLGLGLVTAAIAALVLVRAWSTSNAVSGWVEGILLVGGMGVAISGAARVRPPPSHASPTAPASRDPHQPGADADAGALPRLGEILMYKYHLVTEKDLARAIELQKKGVPRPIGEVLVGMGKITWQDLAQALQDQVGYGDPWKRG